MEDATYFLPCDILFSVFIGLLIKSLLRFKSVSAQWKAIISKDSFVKAQRDQSKASRRGKLLLQSRNTGGFKLIDIENPQIITEPQEEYFPLKNYKVLCSLDGLLLLKHKKYMKFVLWNPSTRQHQNLESCPYVNNYTLPHACGMCYDDSTIDDYNVILIYGLFYVVYSTNTHSWTIRKNLLHLPSYELLLSCFWNRGISRGTSLKGCVYWSLPWNLDENVGKSSTIICFDVKSNELKKLPSPDLYNDQWLLPMALKGCLSLYNITNFGIKSNIWIMDQDGWRLLTKPICDVQPLSLEKHYIALRTHPLCFTGNDELIFCRTILDGTHDLSIYNIEQQRFVMTYYELKYHEFSQDVTCLESLCFPRLN